MRHSISDITETIRDRRTIQPTDYTDREVQRDVIASVDATLSPSPTSAPTKSGLPAAIAVLGIGLLAVAFMAKRR